MKRFPRIIPALALSLMVAAPVAGVEKQPQITSEVVMKEGSKVHLFHSGTADVKKEICLNDVVPVYRETPTGGHTTRREVGKVKVLSYAGDHYFEAQVVDGEVKVGDVAKKQTASCLVQPAR
jgi:hypothetical protein